MDPFEDFIWRLSRQLVKVMGEQMPQPWEPYVELTERQDHVHLAVETPGIKPSDIKVSVSGHQIRLTIRQDGVPAYQQGFRTRPLRADEADILYKNGVIEVKVPYREGFI